MFYQGYTHDKVLDMSHRWFMAMIEHKNKVLKQEQENGKLGRSQTNNKSRY